MGMAKLTPMPLIIWLLLVVVLAMARGQNTGNCLVAVAEGLEGILPLQGEAPRLVLRTL
jgi:H+/gluconate symporter-like permease